VSGLGGRSGGRHHLNDAGLGEIERLYGVTYRHTLGEIIEMNTGIDVQDNVFEVAPGRGAAQRGSTGPFGVR
jgi:hypothetical protein